MTGPGSTVDATGGRSSPEPVRLTLLIRLGRSDQPTDPAPRIVELGELEQVRVGRGEADGAVTLGRALELTLVDPWVSGRHARIAGAARGEDGRDFVLEDLGSRNGTYVQGRRIQRHTLVDGEIVEIGHSFFRFFQGTVEDRGALLRQAHTEGPPGPTSSVCPALLQVLAQIDRLAPTNISMVLRGESGTGKEVLAEAIHRASGRGGRFVAHNCAAIPEALLESELFGHRRGAFTGAAADKQGLVEAAAGGTLLLDEIGDMPLPAQAKVLRLVQDRSFYRLGETTPRQADLRFLAATHRDLERMVQQETFRGDLLARLNGITLNLPALRARREDIGLLLAAFLGQHSAARPPQVEHEAYRALVLHDWPFNIRELSTTVQTALALAPDGRITTAQLRSVWGDRAEAEASAVAAPEAAPAAGGGHRITRQTGDEELSAILEQALTRHQGNVTAVARELGHTRKQIHRWMQRVGLAPARYR